LTKTIATQLKPTLQHYTGTRYSKLKPLRAINLGRWIRIHLRS